MSTARTAPLRISAPTRAVIGTAASQLPSQSCHGVILRAVCPGQILYLGVSSGVTTATGFPMNDGDVLDLAVKNTNELYFIASAAAQGLAVLPYSIN